MMCEHRLPQITVKSSPLQDKHRWMTAAHSIQLYGVIKSPSQNTVLRDDGNSVLFKAASGAITSVLTAVISPEAAVYCRLNGWLMVIYCSLSTF